MSMAVACVYGGQRTTCLSVFSPSTTWILGIELRSSSLVLAASSLVYLAVSPTLVLIHFCL